MRALYGYINKNEQYMNHQILGQWFTLIFSTFLQLQNSFRHTWLLYQVKLSSNWGLSAILSMIVDKLKILCLLLASSCIQNTVDNKNLSNYNNSHLYSLFPTDYFHLTSSAWHNVFLTKYSQHGKKIKFRRTYKYFPEKFHAHEAVMC